MYKNIKLLFSLILVLLLLGGCGSVSSSGPSAAGKKFDTYTIDKKTMDYKFIINGNLYKATGGFCHGMRRGDRVIFLEGSADGKCETAKIKDLETGAVCYFYCNGLDQ